MFSATHAPYFLFTSNILLGFLVEEVFDSTSCFPAKWGTCHSSGLCNCHSSLFLFLHNLEEGNSATPVNWAAVAFLMGCSKNKPLRGQFQNIMEDVTVQSFPIRHLGSSLTGAVFFFFFSLEHLLSLQALNTQQYSTGHGTISSFCSWDTVVSTEWKWILQAHLINCSIPLII